MSVRSVSAGPRSPICGRYSAAPSTLQEDALYRRCGEGVDAEHLVDFYEVPSYLGLSRLIEERATIDFVFVDGAHTFDYVLVDVFLIDKLLRPGGIIILDDLLYPSIRIVCRYVLLNLRYKCAGQNAAYARLAKA